MLGLFSPAKKQRGSDLISSIQSQDFDEQIRRFNRILDYIPQNQNQFLKEQMSYIIKCCLYEDVPEELVYAEFAVLDKICMTPEGSSQVTSHPQIIHALFVHTSRCNIHVLNLISHCFIEHPDHFVSFVVNRPDCFRKFIDAIVDTQSAEGADLFYKIFVSNKEIADSVSNHVAKSMNKLPVPIAIELMLYDPEKFVVDRKRVEEWLRKEGAVPVYTFESICQIYHEIWNSELALCVLSKLSEVEDISSVHWICDMEKQDIKIAARKKYVQHNNPQEVFLELYVQSFYEPSDIDFIPLVLDENLAVVAAALQLIIIWKVRIPTFHLLSGESNPRFTKSLRSLFKAAALTAAVSDGVITRMMFDGDMRVNEESILEEEWRFPHIKDYIEHVNRIPIADIDGAYEALGYILSKIDD